MTRPTRSVDNFPRFFAVSFSILSQHIPNELQNNRSPKRRTMSRRATAKRSAAPSPTPKSTEGGNPSGFILKLFQMVNGAPDDVVTVSKFFVPSFFSFVLFGMGTCYRAGNFARGGDHSSGSSHHNRQHSFSSDYQGKNWGISDISTSYASICHGIKFSSFVPVLPPGPHFYVPSCQVLPPNTRTFRYISSHTTIYVRISSSGVFVPISTNVLQPFVPPSMKQIFGTFFLCYQDVHMASRISSHPNEHSNSISSNAISPGVGRGSFLETVRPRTSSLQFSFRLEPLPNFFFLFENEARASPPIIACFPPTNSTNYYTTLPANEKG